MILELSESSVENGLMALQKQMWITLFFVVLLSIWNYRNRIIFDKATMYQVKHKLGFGLVVA